MSMSNKSGQNQAKKLPVHKDPSLGKATQFKPGQSGNPDGRPKGRLSLSTHIQNMLNDEEFETWLAHPKEGWIQYKGAPVQAIIRAAMLKAASGDMKAADWLAKYGYGTRVEVTGPEGGPVRALVEIIDSGKAANGKG